MLNPWYHQRFSLLLHLGMKKLPKLQFSLEMDFHNSYIDREMLYLQDAVPNVVGSARGRRFDSFWHRRNTPIHYNNYLPRCTPSAILDDLSADFNGKIIKTIGELLEITDDHDVQLEEEEESKEEAILQHQQDNTKVGRRTLEELVHQLRAPVRNGGFGMISTNQLSYI